MHKLVGIFFLLLTSLGNSQGLPEEKQIIVDSLFSVINSEASHDTSRADAYLGLSEILYVVSLDTMVYFCMESKSIAEKGLASSQSKEVKESFIGLLGGVYNNLGYAKKQLGDIDAALEYYEEGLELCREVDDKVGIGSVLNNIATIYNNRGEVKKALELYHESLKIREEIGDKKSLATVYNNIGYIYRQQDNLDKALEYYKQSLALLEEIENKRGIGRSLNSIGAVYNHREIYDTAYLYWSRSLAIRLEIKDFYGMAESYANLAIIYRERDNDLERALVNFDSALVIYEGYNIPQKIAGVLINKSKILFLQGKDKKAKEYSYRALGLAKGVGYMEEIKRSADILYLIEKKQGNTGKALEMYELSIQMRDSVQNNKNQKEIFRQEYESQYEKQFLLDSLSFAQKEQLKEVEYHVQLDKEREEKAKQRVITYSIGGGLVFVLLFLVFVFNRLKVTRKQKNIIEDQKRDVEVAHLELGEKNKEIMDSINYAKRIQSAILPPPKIVKEYLKESFILYKPKDVVAGDFYWMEQKDGKVLFAAADCTGHGVPGAMVSVVCNNGLNRSVRELGLTEPGLILDKTREIVIQEFEKSEEEVNDGMDIALCTLEGNKLQYAGAHNPLWIIRNGEVLETKADKQPIGKFEKTTPYTTHTVELEKGDAIYIFSDGYVDQFGGEKGKKFKAKAFKGLLLSIQENPMDQQKVLIDNVFEKWKGELEQIDDVCVIGVKY